MNNKRVVFYLLLMVVSTGLITFGLYHYQRLMEPLKVADSYSMGKGKILVTSEKINQQDLLKRYKHCSLHRGIPLEIESDGPGTVIIKKISPLPEHRDLSLKEGDHLLNSGFLVSPEDQHGSLQKITDTGSVEKVNYVPAIILYCVP